MESCRLKRFSRYRMRTRPFFWRATNCLVIVVLAASITIPFASPASAQGGDATPVCDANGSIRERAGSLTGGCNRSDDDPGGPAEGGDPGGRGDSSGPPYLQTAEAWAAFSCSFEGYTWKEGSYVDTTIVGQLRLNDGQVFNIEAFLT